LFNPRKFVPDVVSNPLFTVRRYPGMEYVNVSGAGPDPDGYWVFSGMPSKFSSCVAVNAAVAASYEDLSVYATVVALAVADRRLLKATAAAKLLKLIMQVPV